MRNLLPRDFAAAFSALRQAHSWRWLTYGIAVGLAAGLAASCYFVAVEWLQAGLVHHLAGVAVPSPKSEHLFSVPLGAYRPWLVPVFLSLVGLVTGFFIQRYVPDSVNAGTDGTDATTRAFHRAAGHVPPLVPLIRGLASVLTIGAGGSAGREGPIAQIGGGIGSWLAERFRLTPHERRMLLLAGAAGGLGAIFRAPLGGALTAVEVIYREDFEAEAMLPAVMSSVTAYSVFSFFFGTQSILAAPAFEFRDPRELVFYAVMAVFCSAAGYFFVRTFRTCKTRLFVPLREKIGIMWTLALGGLVMGCIGALFPQTLGGGYGWLEMAILGQMPAFMLFAVLIGKTVATSVTIGSGLSGGMFAPALMIGGLAGGLVGQGAHALWPNIATQPGSYVLVGMAAFFSGIAKAPIGPLVMVCELSRGYGLLAPLMLSTALCIGLCRRVSLYDNQVSSKFDSPAHVADATLNLLERRRVGEHFVHCIPVVLEAGSTLAVMADLMRRSQGRSFPVRGEDGRLAGMVDVHELRPLVFERGLYNLVVASELMGPLFWVTVNENLYSALLKFAECGYSQLPVLAAEPEPGRPEPRLVGMLNRREVFRAYARSVRQVREIQGLEKGEPAKA